MNVKTIRKKNITTTIKTSRNVRVNVKPTSYTSNKVIVTVKSK